MKRKILPSLRVLLIAPPVLLGIVAVAMFALRGDGPQRRLPEELSRVLRVIKVPKIDVAPRVLGFGTAQPGQIWRAIAEVKGKVVEVHRQLKPGAILEKDQVLLRIDTAEYDLAVAQLNAQIEEVKAQLSELETREANDRASLQIEQDSLVLAKRDLQRLNRLAQGNAASRSAVDQQQRNVLLQRQNVQKLTSSLNIMPQKKAAMKAGLAVKQASLDQARLDLEKTTIRTPFSCRLAQVRIDQGQFLSAGELLFEAHSTALTEIEARVPIQRMRILLSSHQRESLSLPIDMETIAKKFALKAVVRLRMGELTAEWKGRFTRLREQLDPQTRTLGVVIAVDEPYRDVIPGQHPPLIEGMFCEVELQGKAQPRIVVPRVALHNGHVYLVGKDNRLLRRKVKVEFTQSTFVCVEEGLLDGDTLVVSDPTPAIEGMLVQPVLDEVQQRSLLADAAGQGGLP